MTDRFRLAASLQGRVPYDVSKPMFELHQVPRGRGWLATAEKLVDRKSIPDAKIELLLGALRDHVLVGEKLCRFYLIDEKIMELMKRRIGDVQIPDGNMQKAFPYILDEATLEGLPLGHPEIVSIERFSSGTAVVFGSVRAIRTRTTVDPDSFPEGSIDFLARFDEVIGLKLIRYQAFDLVWLSNIDSVIDLRIDCPKGTHVDIGRAAQISTIEAFSRHVDFNPFGTPANVFPLLSRMYEAKDEGRVVELAFGTTTRSIKHERMRLSGECLRAELYHIGGKANLRSPVRPFKLSLSYQFEIGNEIDSCPELNLHATSLVGENPDPQLFDAVIRKAVGLNDYDYVRKRLLHFLNS